MKDILIYLLLFLGVCVIWFLVTRLWVGVIDLFVDVLKRLFKIGRREDGKKWHVLEKEKSSGK